MLFILNRQEKVINILKNYGNNSSLSSYFDDSLVEMLSTGAETFSFSTVAQGNLFKDLVVGNYIAFKKGKSYKLFQIMQVETRHDSEMIISVYCECAGLDLINKLFRARKINSCSLRKFIDTITEETGWNTGFIDATLLKTFDLDLENDTVYATLQNNISKFEGEIEFRVELKKGRISNKFIDVYANRGKITGKRFVFGKDIEGITRTIDSTSLYTALKGVGKNSLSFKGIEVDGIDKPVGQDFVADQEAYERYNNNGYHIMGLFEYDTESPEELLRETYKQLQKVKEPKVTYEIPIALLADLLGKDWEKVNIGDTVSIFDNAFNPPLMLMARVSQLETSETNPYANSCTFTNFIEVSSNITDEMRKLASKLEGYVDNNIQNKFPIGSEDIQEGAVNGTHMDATYVSQVTADIVKASTVEANKIVTEKIEAVEGEFSRLEADVIEANKIVTDKIEAVEGEFETIEATLGKIDNIVSGNISSENIQTGGITGDNLNMDTIFVSDANIINVNADKITSGKVNTNNVTIESENGGIVIADNTQQFKDKNGKVRVQIGQDAKGDFNFGVFDETGTGVLIDATGVKEQALADGIIKDRMIGQGEIDGSKIDISSLVTEVNKDTNTTVIKGSKILLDTEGQKLDVAFNSLKAQADETKKQTESNTTQIGIEQGKINTLIQDTTITKDGQTVKLKDEYSKLEQTVGGIKTSIGQQQTTINEHTGKITATESKVSTLEQTVNGFNSELSHVKTTIDEQEEAIGSVNSALSGKANSSDVYKKSETMTTSAINSAINQSADSIKLGISETYETKTNVETKVTTTLNSAKSYADTKKAEAITQAGKDADSKVNSAKNELNTAINKKANSVDVYKKSETYTKSETDSAIKVAKDNIELGVKNTYETKTNVETKVNNAVNNIQIGGRNLFLNSGFTKGLNYWYTYNCSNPQAVADSSALSGYAVKFTSTGGGIYQRKGGASNNPTNYQNGSVMTVSGYVKSSVAGKVLRPNFENAGMNTSKDITCTNADTWYYFTHTYTITSHGFSTITFYGDSGADYYLKDVILEYGNKASTWTPAPEDVQASIDLKAEKTDVYSKSEVYTKSQTDSAINVAKDSINLGVSQTYETKTNVTSKINTAKTEAVNSAVNTSKSYADTKKAEAISTASTDATNKVNSAKNELNTAINKKANSTDVYTKTETYTKSETDSKIKVAQDNINLSVSNTYETKSNVTNKINTAKNEAINSASTDATNKVNSAKNELNTAINKKANSSDVYTKSEVYTKNETNSQINVAKDSITNTVSSTYLSKSDATNTYATKSSLTQTSDKIVADFKASGGYNLLKNSDAKNGTSYWASNGGGISVATAGADPFHGQKEFKTSFPSGIKYNEDLRLKSNTDYVYEAWIYTNTALTSSSITPLHFWCSSTEGTSGQSQCTIIDYRQDLKANAYTKVYVHFKTKSGNVFFRPFIYSSATAGMICVKQVSLSEGIVESPWSPHPDEVYSGSTVIDASGITINNGALTVKNKSGTTVLTGDSNGNLVFTGTAKSQSGAQWVGLDSGGITLQDSQKNEQMLRIGTSYFTSNRDMNGVTLAMPQYSDFLRVAHIAKADLTNGWSSSDTQYNFMDFWSGAQTVDGVSYKKGINVYSPMFVNNGIQLFSGTNHPSEILGAVSWDNGKGTIWNMMGLYGDNGAILGYKNGSNLQARFIVTEASHPGTGDNLISWGNYNFNGYTFHNANIVAKSLSVSGSKNCLQETKNYGSRLINAYETAEYYFGDLGFGQINEDGECLVSLDDIFLECVNTDVQYHVFTQVYEGAIKSIERHKTYFIVKGEPNTSFSWEIKAKRIDYENVRLDVQELETFQPESGLELFSDDDFKADTSEDILLATLNFNLEDILLITEE